MGVRWAGLPFSPLLETNISSRSLDLLSHRAMFTSHSSLIDLGPSASNIGPTMIGPPPPSPILPPLASPNSFPSPLSLPSPRLQISSPTKIQGSPVTPSSGKYCKCNGSSRPSACVCMSVCTPRSALTALPQNTQKPKALSVRPVNCFDSAASLYTKESDVTHSYSRRSDLNRKRPRRLQIPIELTCSPSFQARADTDSWKDITVEGDFYGMACRKGRREILEDAFCALPGPVNGDPGLAFFGVFDGHGGRNAAEFAAEHLAQNIIESFEKGTQEAEAGFESAIRNGYLSTDAAFLKTNAKSGASCVTALLKDGVMVVANAGDCRAVASRAGVADVLTSDHRVCREDERRRIENLGGYVDCYGKVWRLQGSLSISRGIGDSCYKKWISAEPEIKSLHLSRDYEFLILASDGLWDVVSNQEAVDCVRNILIPNDGKMQLRIPESKASSENTECMPTYNKIVAAPLVACQSLVNLAVARGSLDDVSVLIVHLQHFVKN